MMNDDTAITVSEELTRLAGYPVDLGKNQWSGEWELASDADTTGKWTVLFASDVVEDVLNWAYAKYTGEPA